MSNSHLKDEALDRTMWTARFGWGFGPVVRQTANWIARNCREFAARSALSHCCSVRLVFVLNYICSQQWTRHAMYASRDTEALSCNRWYGGKAISITYAECAFVVFGIEHAIRMRNIIVCGLSGSSIFSTLFHDFRKKMLLNKKRLLWFSL